MPDEPASGNAAPVPKVTFLGKRGHNPIWQGLAVLVASVIGMAIAHSSIGTAQSVWKVAATFLLLFSAANPLLGIFKVHWWKYLAVSVPVYAAVSAAVIYLATRISGSALGELREFHAFFILEFLFYVLITGLVGIYRFVLGVLNEMK